MAKREMNTNTTLKVVIKSEGKRAKEGRKEYKHKNNQKAMNQMATVSPIDNYFKCRNIRDG